MKHLCFFVSLVFPLILQGMQPDTRFCYLAQLPPEVQNYITAYLTNDIQELEQNKIHKGMITASQPVRIYKSLCSGHQACIGYLSIDLDRNLCFSQVQGNMMSYRILFGPSRQSRIEKLKEYVQSWFNYNPQMNNRVERAVLSHNNKTIACLVFTNEKRFDAINENFFYDYKIGSIVRYDAIHPRSQLHAVDLCAQDVIGFLAKMVQTTKNDEEAEKIFRLEPEKVWNALKKHSPVWALAITNDGSRIAFNFGYQVFMLDVKTKSCKKLWEPELHIQANTFDDAIKNKIDIAFLSFNKAETMLGIYHIVRNSEIEVIPIALGEPLTLSAYLKKMGVCKKLY